MTKVTAKTAIGVLVDNSGSMTPDIQDVRDALTKANESVMLYGGTLAVWAFSNWKSPAAHLVLPFGEHNRGRVKDRLKALDGYGGTFLAPALTEVAAALQDVVTWRRVLVVILDGLVVDFSESLAAVAGISDIELYGILIGSVAPEDIERMRELFGARLAVANNIADIETLLVALI